MSNAAKTHFAMPKLLATYFLQIQILKEKQTVVEVSHVCIRNQNECKTCAACEQVFNLHFVHLQTLSDHYPSQLWHGGEGGYAQISTNLEIAIFHTHGKITYMILLSLGTNYLHISHSTDRFKKHVF